MNPFRGILFFHHIDEELPSAVAVLKACHWDIDYHNAPHLAGKEAAPVYGLVELTVDQAFGTAPRAELPKEWSESDKLTIVGDISHVLGTGSDVIVACTTNFKQAGELAEKMGYRPAKAGEFLQLLSWLQHHNEQYGGWFYCYAGRKPQYAILAEYNGYQSPSSLNVIFDTHIGGQVGDGYVTANADTYCLFVRC